MVRLFGWLIHDLEAVTMAPALRVEGQRRLGAGGEGNAPQLRESDHSLSAGERDRARVIPDWNLCRSNTRLSGRPGPSPAGLMR
jgi:hypothetical protein